MKNAHNTRTVTCEKSKIDLFTSVRMKNIVVFPTRLGFPT